MAYDPEARASGTSAVVIGLVALVLVVGAVWFYAQRPADVVTHENTTYVDRSLAPAPASPPVVVNPPASSPPAVVVSPPASGSSSSTSSSTTSSTNTNPAANPSAGTSSTDSSTTTTKSTSP